MTIRTDYHGSELHQHTVAPTPLHQALRWFREAVARQEEQGDIPEPGALFLATVGADGAPSLRTVLLRFLDTDGPGFVSHLGSRKADQLEQNPKVAASLVWLPLFRQVHFRGIAERIDDDLVAEYWATRPRGSQLSAVASEQSRPIASRDALQQKFSEAEARYVDVEDIPKPEHFVAWRIRPTEVEFWSGQGNRLHDRLLFSQPGHLGLGDPGWKVTRLQP